MFDFMKNELYYALNKLVEANVLTQENTIVFFGYNHHARLSISYLIGAGYSADNMRIVDNYADGNYCGIEVCRPEAILAPWNSQIIVLLATARNNEIKKQLKKLGYRNNQCIVTLNKSSLMYKYGSHLRIKSPNKYNRALNGIGYVWYKKNHPDICAITEQNEKFKNIHAGERCFIMGNGPSIKNIDLSLLKDEYVFGVNQVTGIKNWENANINSWVCIDGDFLGLWTNANLHFFDELKKINNPNIEAFVPVEAKRNIERYQIDKCMKVNYVNFKQQFINLDQKLTIDDIDMRKHIMQPYNVVIACINIAIYMGFSKIYLLGCNQSVLLSEIGEFLNAQTVEMHGIEGEDLSKSITLERLKSKGMYHEIKTQLTQLAQFRVLAEYAQKKGIEIVNLSSPTLIESIPQGEFTEVI